ncbi:MAG: hypothetical protein Q9179_002864 [Wetmoreana sp. 5 TL-2023]
MSINERGSGSAGAPQSSIARTFSADLNNAFSMDKNLDGLVQSVEQKKQAVSSQSQELEALEARLRETEEKLKEKQSSPTGKGTTVTGRQRQTVAASHSTQDQAEPTTSGMDPFDRPLERSGRQAPSQSTMSYWMPGALPETPGDPGQNNYMASGRNNA